MLLSTVSREVRRTVSGKFCTVTSTNPLLPPNAAKIVSIPGLSAVSRPPCVIEATVGSLLDQRKVTGVICAPARLRATALSACVRPTVVKVTGAGVIVIVLTVLLTMMRNVSNTVPVPAATVLVSSTEPVSMIVSVATSGLDASCATRLFESTQVPPIDEAMVSPRAFSVPARTTSGVRGSEVNLTVPDGASSTFAGSLVTVTAIESPTVMLFAPRPPVTAEATSVAVPAALAITTPCGVTCTAGPRDAQLTTLPKIVSCRAFLTSAVSVIESLMDLSTTPPAATGAPLNESTRILAGSL